MRDDDGLYIGWSTDTPPSAGRRARVVTVALLVAAPLLAALLVVSQRPFAASRFDFGDVRAFSGTVALTPIPTLVVDRPGGGTSRWVLVDQGKHGADARLLGLDGHRVHLEGTLVYRDGDTMLELADTAISDEGPRPPVDAAVGAADGTVEDLGEVTTQGEIVDSKCFLGVMNPGDLKPHRECAVRCISGGIPPMLVVRHADGTTNQVLLVGAEGEPVNDRVLDLVAEPVEISGRLQRVGNQFVLRADPAGYRRLSR